MEVSAGTWNRNNRIGGELVSWQRSSEHSVIYQHGWYRNTKLNNDSRQEVQPRVYCSQLACNGFVHMEKSLPAFWPILRPPRQRRPASHETTHASWPLFSGCQRAGRCHESRRGRITAETLSLPLWRLCNSRRALVHLRPFLLNNNKNTGEGAAEQRNGFLSSSEHRSSRWSDACERSVSPR